MTVASPGPRRTSSTIVASPTFAVVPAGRRRGPGALAPGDGFVGSGGYVADGDDRRQRRSTANEHYWAGPPGDRDRSSWSTTSAGGARSTAFEDGDIDYRRSSPFDATWIAYDETLGPQLREADRCRSSYYGFDTTPAAVRRRPGPPGVRARPSTGGGSSPSSPRAATVATAWSRRASPAGATRTSCRPRSRPPPGRCSPTAGYPGRCRLPGDHDADVRRAVRRGGRRRDPARARHRAHVRDDGVGRLLRPAGRGSARRSGRWAGSRTTRAATTSSGILLGSRLVEQLRPLESAAFDAAIADALAATDPAAARAAFDRAETIVRDEAPVVPLTYGAAGRCRATACSAPARTASGSSGWRGSHGRTDAGRRRRRALAAAAVLLGCSAVAPRPALGRRRRPGRPSATPTATSTFGKDDRVQAAGHARRGRSQRVEILLTTPGAIGPTVIAGRRRPASGAPTLTYNVDRRRTATSSRTRRSRPAGASPTDDGEAWLGPRPDASVYADDRFDLEDARRRRRPGPLVRGRADASGGGRSQIGDDAVATTAKLLGVTETEPDRLLHLRRPGRVLRRARARRRARTSAARPTPTSGRCSR